MKKNRYSTSDKLIPTCGGILGGKQVDLRQDVLYTTWCEKCQRFHPLKGAHDKDKQNAE